MATKSSVAQRSVFTYRVHEACLIKHIDNVRWNKQAPKRLYILFIFLGIREEQKIKWWSNSLDQESIKIPNSLIISLIISKCKLSLKWRKKINIESQERKKTPIIILETKYVVVFIINFDIFFRRIIRYSEICFFKRKNEQKGRNSLYHFEKVKINQLELSSVVFV